MFFQSDIMDVNTIFKDLATMVHEQGEMVDSIEQNVESAHVRVQEGAAQLSMAATYKVSWDILSYDCHLSCKWGHKSWAFL